MLLHWSVCTPHVVNQDHRVRDLVQVHAHCCLDVKTDADPATFASLCYFQVPAQEGRNEVRSVWYSVRLIIIKLEVCMQESLKRDS